MTTRPTEAEIERLQREHNALLEACKLLRMWLRKIELADVFPDKMRGTEFSLMQECLRGADTAIAQAEEHDQSPERLARYVNSWVITKVALKRECDRRGNHVPRDSKLLVVAAHGDTLDLNWPDGRRAANQVHFNKLATG